MGTNPARVGREDQVGRRRGAEVEPRGLGDRLLKSCEAERRVWKILGLFWLEGLTSSLKKSP